jgi:signal transduction histidine kinase
MEPRPANRSLLDRHPVAVDAVLVGGLLALAIAGTVGQDAGSVAAWLWIPLLILPLPWRRRWPEPVFALLAAFAFGQWLTTGPSWADLSLLLALYEVAAKRSVSRLAAAVAVMELGALLAALKWGQHRQFYLFIFLSALVLATAALGRTSQVRRRYLRGLEERAERLERERDAQAQIAAAAERGRIARELHDIVAHNLSVMTALATGASYWVHRDPDEAERVMDLSASAGREALDDMRRLLGVLRAEDGPTAPQPGTDDIPDLLQQVRVAGLGVTFDDAGDGGPLPAAIQLTVYRLVQEALTNSLKHAGADAEAVVRVRHDDEIVDLEIVDSGGKRAPATIAPSGGQGLNGMRERAGVYDGEVEAGPTPEGGWRVKVQLKVPGGERLPA